MKNSSFHLLSRDMPSSECSCLIQECSNLFTFPWSQLHASRATLDSCSNVTEEQETYLIALNDHPTTMQASTYLSKEWFNFDLEDNTRTYTKVAKRTNLDKWLGEEVKEVKAQEWQDWGRRWTGNIRLHFGLIRDRRANSSDQSMDWKSFLRPLQNCVIKDSHGVCVQNRHRTKF